MAKAEVGWQKYLVEALEGLDSGGLLLSSLDDGGRANAMTIGWASFGVMWGRPTAVVLVRPSRYTFGCIEATGDFAVSVPYPEMADAVKFCGTKSGRNVDKFAECGFTALNVDGVRSPGIAECGLVFFCRVLHRNDVLPPELDRDVQTTCYPSGDYHRFYHGEISVVLADQDFVSRRLQADRQADRRA